MTDKKKSEQRLFFLPITFQEDELTSGKIYWKQILAYGKVKHPQNLNIELDIDEDFVDNIITAFEEDALEKVPILAGTHDNSAIERTVGIISELRKTDDGLDAKMEITDEDISDLVDTKTSDGTSLLSGVSVYVAPAATKEGKVYPDVLWHVAITNFPWMTGLDDFEEIAASHSVYTLPRYVKFENLSRRVDIVRNAYYDKLNMDFWSYSYVKEVHDNFIIEDTGTNYVRYSYEIDSDGEVQFGEPELVTVQYVEMNTKESTLANDDKDKNQKSELSEQSKKFFASHGVENFDGVTTLINELKKEKTDLEAANKVMSEEKNSLADRVVSLENARKLTDATVAVEGQIAAGKIVPAQKTSYIELHMSNSEMFNSLMEKAPVIVDTKEYGLSPDKKDIDGTGLSNEDVQSEIDRIKKLRAGA